LLQFFYVIGGHDPTPPLFHHFFIKNFFYTNVYVW
jgi:hypothetical protein